MGGEEGDQQKTRGGPKGSEGHPFSVNAWTSEDKAAQGHQDMELNSKEPGTKTTHPAVIFMLVNFPRCSRRGESGEGTKKRHKKRKESEKPASQEAGRPLLFHS